VRGVTYEDRDVSRDQAAVRDLVNKYRSRSTPTIIIDDQVIVGFDPERLDQLLAT